MSTSATLYAALDAARIAVTDIPDQLGAVKALDDNALVSSQRELAELRRIIDARSSLVAGEIAYRSRRELGYSGLAQKAGFQSAEKLVQATTGSTRREASTLVVAGALVYDSMILSAVNPATGELPDGFVGAEAFAAREPWLAMVGAAVAEGSLTIDAARAIRSGLGEPGQEDSGVTCAALDIAARTLLHEAHGQGERDCDSGSESESESSSGCARGCANGCGTTGLNADELFRRARALRDELDLAGIAQREQLMYTQRSLRKTIRPNGLPRYTLDPDLEMSAWLDDVYDKLTSPRRGGPRFVDSGDRAWSEAIAIDARSIEQYLHDAFVGLLRKGVDADLADAAADVADAAADLEEASTMESGTVHAGTRQRHPRIVGSRVPSVRVLVTEETLRTRSGHGRIEGIDTPISIETVERQICVSGILPIRFGVDGNVIDLGRETRLFTSRQKVALAARDGGCLFGVCDRPPSWTEAHHINHWVRDGGKTDLADGVLLCRHHHMLVHNNHWEIERRGTKYWLIPPPEIDPQQYPRPMTSKSDSLRDLQHQTGLPVSA